MIFECIIKFSTFDSQRDIPEPDIWFSQFSIHSSSLTTLAWSGLLWIWGSAEHRTYTHSHTNLHLGAIECNQPIYSTACFWEVGGK